MSELLNLSGKVPDTWVHVFRAIAVAATEQSIDYVVVGAAARDLVLHYGYGVAIQRGTEDLDFAVEVGTWESYAALRDALCSQGFEHDRNQKQRMRSAEGILVDIVPFGDIANDHGNIAWPPDRTPEMNILGFQEAWTHADIVRMHEEPLLEIPVVSPIGFVFLKLIAWRDRQRQLREKDAVDIGHVLTNYVNFPSEVTGLWDLQDLLELLAQFDESADLVAAAVLGLPYTHN